MSLSIKVQAASENAVWHEGWERWIASNLLGNCRPSQLIDRLIERGFDPDFAAHQISEVEASPIFKASQAMLMRIEKLESLLQVVGELQSQQNARLDEHDGMSVSRFYTQYVRQNRPILLRGVASHWPAVREWTIDRLTDLLGDTEIDVTAERSDDLRFEENFRHHIRRWTFRRFAQTISAAPGNDVYVVSKNRLLMQPEAAPLLADFKPHLPYLEKPADDRDAGLWIGPAGTVTPLHHDACNILFVQVHGRKRVSLIAPTYLPRLYNMRTCFSDFDPERPDFDRFPRVRNVPVMTANLGPGDALFIPVGWWHHVRSLDTSISLSFTQFRLPRAAHVWRWRPREAH